jgi:predicted nucleic acid-binding protein
MILCDTNILIDLINGEEKARNFILNYPPENILISVISEWGVLIGARDRIHFKSYQKALKRFRVLEINQETSAIAGILIKRYNLNQGLLIPDALIAASAMRWKLMLATQNKKDFQFLPGVSLVEY